MFPSANRESKIIKLNPSSPKDQRANNNSGHLPFFKRLPHNRFKSEERVKVKNGHNLSNLSPPRSNYEFNFFKEHQQQQPEQRYNFSSSIVNRRPSKIRTRNFNKAQLFKHLNKQPKRQQSQGTKLRHKTQDPTVLKITVQNALSSKANKPSKALTAAKILQMEKGILTQLEIVEIGAYEEIYYYGQHCSNKKENLKEMSNEDGGYLWVRGDHIAYRYEILDQLGQGSFGQVFKCLDHKRKIELAVKVVKDKQKYTKQARIQINILNYIKAKDPLSSKNCIQIREFFMFRSRMCMTFDLLSMNLYQLTKNNGYYGFPLDLIRRFALQLLNAIYFLHKNNIIHADLKPENILLKEANKSGIKIIDFGSSCFQHETIYTYIQSRYYRAPEVILGMPYNRKIDIWSFGCIMAELHLGYPIFAGEDEHQQLCYLLQVLGRPPQSIIHSAKRWKVFFNSEQLKPHQKKSTPGSKSLMQCLENPSEQEFVEFINSCFTWVPDKRIEALGLLKSDWIIKGLPDDIRRQHLKFISEEQQKYGIFDDQHQIKKLKKSSFSIRQRNRLI